MNDLVQLAFVVVALSFAWLLVSAGIYTLVSTILLPYEAKTDRIWKTVEDDNAE